MIKISFKKWFKKTLLLCYKNAFGWRRFFILDYWKLKLS